VREGLYKEEGRKREKGGRESEGGLKLNKGPRAWTVNGQKNQNFLLLHFLKLLFFFFLFSPS